MRLRMMTSVLSKLLAAGFDVESQLSQSQVKLVESLVKQFAVSDVRVQLCLLTNY